MFVFTRIPPGSPGASFPPLGDAVISGRLAAGRQQKGHYCRFGHHLLQTVWPLNMLFRLVCLPAGGTDREAKAGVKEWSHISSAGGWASVAFTTEAAGTKMDESARQKTFGGENYQDCCF